VISRARSLRPGEPVSLFGRADFVLTVSCHLISEERLQQFEAIFVRFLHLLAHHPDFSKELEDVKLFAK
jgi:hypothetical protein